MRTPEILTGRLSLTQLLPGDADALFAYRSLPEVFRFQSWASFSLEEAQRLVEEMNLVEFNTTGTWYQLGIRLRSTQELIGDLGIHFLPEDDRQVEIGFTLAPAHQGKGLGTEAVAALFDLLFEQLGKHRVIASVDPHNQASLRLLKRLGMRQEAHFHQSIFFKGNWADDLVFAMLGEEWAVRKQGEKPYVC